MAKKKRSLIRQPEGPVYDATLKELINEEPRAMAKTLMDEGIKEFLNIEFNRVTQKRVDVVAEMTDDRIHHLEIQSSPDSKMPWRMLEYLTLIHDRYPERQIFQQVLYVGDGPCNIETGLELDGLSYRYKVTDIRTIPPQVLLDSPFLQDQVLSILCDPCDPEALAARVRGILQRAVSVHEQAAIAKAANAMVILTALRSPDAGIAVYKEIEAMSIRIDLTKSPVLTRINNSGFADALRIQAEVEFGSVPEWLEKILLSASHEQLVGWQREIASGKGFEEVFEQRSIGVHFT